MTIAEFPYPAVNPFPFDLWRKIKDRFQHLIPWDGEHPLGSCNRFELCPGINTYSRIDENGITAANL
jgi:hypothetical protein